MFGVRACGRSCRRACRTTSPFTTTTSSSSAAAAAAARPPKGVEPVGALVMAGHTDTVWNVAMHCDRPVMAIVGADRLLRCWDYTTKRVLYTQRQGTGLLCADFNHDGSRLGLGHTNGEVEVLETRKLSSVMTVNTNARGGVNCIKFSPDDKILAVGCADSTLYLFYQGGREVVLREHSAGILHVQFSKCNKYLMSQSKDNQLLFWSLATHRRLANPPCCQWVRWSCTLGWAVAGIHQGDTTMPNDINCAAIGSDLDLDDPAPVRAVVIGDDFSCLQVFKFPVLDSRAPRTVFRGHGSHVMDVRFSYDDEYVFSCGGHDRAVMQWKLISAKPGQDSLFKRSFGKVNGPRKKQASTIQLSQTNLW
mmetsp:Transcript_44730/g.87657  ORF Transcript_44730/g.87657 Transcript_44730/m.87657 type:complete len:364 (-) Transcript_44730:171-1262(-)